MENFNTYRCHNIFMVRTPSLPINVYSELVEKYNNNVENLIKDYNLYQFFEENLLISSKALYNSFEKYTINKEEGKTKKIKKYNESLLKYMIRSSTRPTPFGGFSKVGLSKFTNNNSDISISKDLVTKKISVDNSWLHFIVNLFENNIDTVSQLNLKINSLSYKYGNRFKNPFCSNLGSENISNRNNIKYSNLIQQIKDELNSFKSFKELRLSILSKYEGIDIKIVNDTIMKLIKSEFILTDLRIDLLSQDPLKKLIHRLESLELNIENKEILAKLKELDSLIFLYNNYNYDISNIKKIYSIMESIHKSNTYLMLNTGIKFNNNSIDINIKKDLEEFINIFKYLCVEKKDISNNESIEIEFQEKYGANIDIPFIDFIDPNGFNAIKKFRNRSNNKLISKREEKIKALLEKKILLSYLNNHEEVIIEEKDIADEIKSNTELPVSFDLNVFITRNKKNKYNYFIGPNVGSHEGGATYQRFEEVLDNDIFQEYMEIYNKKNKLTNDEYITAEIKEINSNGRITNIFNKTRNYKYYVNFGFPSNNNNGEIKLEDLSIGIDNNNLFYINYKNNKRIKFILDNMLNPDFINDVAYILNNITNKYTKSLLYRIFMFNNISRFFRPRIKVGKVIVSPKTWILYSDDFTIENRSVFLSELKDHISKFAINKHVYLKTGDNRLLINLDKDIYNDIILSSLKKHKVIEFSEIECDLIDGGIVVDEYNNKYVSEFVFTFIVENYKNVKKVSKSEKIINDNRCFNLFSDGWVYFKVYGVGDSDLDILNSIENELRPYLDTHLFFFIRYIDNLGNHLRVRFKFKDKKTSIVNIEKVSDWLKNIEDNKMINKVVFDVYERETNRYGGINLISKVEELFESDSEFVISLLNYHDTKSKEELDRIYLFGVLSILKTLTKNKEELHEILMEFDSLEYRKEFHKSNSKYIDFVDNILNENIEIFIQEEAVLKKYLSRKNKLIQLRDLINNEKSFNNIQNIKDILLSISHMFCNRLYGNTDYEKRILSLAYLSINGFINKIKYK
ncbi:TPA: thiopeptide-type bacteriocin biosynthesis protein [Clostridioides difficile]|nr:thiopeptide-type bacteriocin biosynthesis protein [Clostridioides difficile]